MPALLARSATTRRIRARLPHARGILTEQYFLRLLVYHRERVDRFRNGIGSLGSRSRLHAREPRCQVREVFQLLALSLVRHDPRIRSHVGNRVIPADVRTAIAKMLVE